MAYSIGSTVEGAGGNGVTTVDAANFTPAAGSALVAFIAYYSGSPLTITMSDTAGGNDTWAEVGSETSYNSDRFAVHVLLNAAAASTTVRAAFSGSVNYPSLVVVEVSGIATSSAVVGHSKQSQNNPGTGSDLISSGNTGTLTGQPAAVIGSCIEIAATYTAPSAGTGFTDLGTFSGGSIRCQHKRVTATTAVASTMTDATEGSASTYMSAVVALLEGGATQSNAPRAAHQMKLMGAM